MSLSFQKKSFCYRLFCSFLILTFTLNFNLPSKTFAQAIPQTFFNLPTPGSMVSLTAPYNPVLIKGLTLYPNNPLEFDFLINSGNSDLEGEALKEEANKLIKYFLASLTVPEEDLWVNLSPYEKDRIIPQGFGVTEMGMNLLAQDYVLKQLTASLMYPEDNLGKEFWQRIYAKAQKLFGTTEIPINTFNKIWIVPSKAVVYEKDNHVFVIESRLKVMLEEDYLALQKNMGNEELAMDQMEESQAQEINKISSDVVREVLIPEIEKEVNEGKSFANLRQIHNSLILATWYKMNLKESLLGQVYADQNKIKGVDVEDKETKEKIYQQYLEAFKKGVYNYIKEDFDPATQEIIPRQYFSGGWDSTKESELLVAIEDDEGGKPSPAQLESIQEDTGGPDSSVHTVIFENTTPADLAVARLPKTPEAGDPATPQGSEDKQKMHPGGARNPARLSGEASTSAEADDRAALRAKFKFSNRTVMTALFPMTLGMAEYTTSKIGEQAIQIGVGVLGVYSFLVILNIVLIVGDTIRMTSHFLWSRYTVRGSMAALKYPAGDKKLYKSRINFLTKHPGNPKIIETLLSFMLETDYPELVQLAVEAAKNLGQQINKYLKLI